MFLCDFSGGWFLWVFLLALNSAKHYICSAFCSIFCFKTLSYWNHLQLIKKNIVFFEMEFVTEASKYLLVQISTQAYLILWLQCWTRNLKKLSHLIWNSYHICCLFHSTKDFMNKWEVNFLELYVSRVKYKNLHYISPGCYDFSSLYIVATHTWNYRLFVG